LVLPSPLISVKRPPKVFLPIGCRLHHLPSEKVLGTQLDHAAEFVQANQAWLPRMVWMDTPPQHFATPSGMYTKQLRKLPKPWRCSRMSMYDSAPIQQVWWAGEGVWMSLCRRRWVCLARVGWREQNAGEGMAGAEGELQGLLDREALSPARLARGGTGLEVRALFSGQNAPTS
jgi:hypothetical protein